MPKQYWTRSNKRSIKVPAYEGWYWCKYKGKHGTIVCPCEVTWLNDETFFVRTARNDVYSTNTAPTFGVIYFGDKIEQPDA